MTKETKHMAMDGFKPLTEGYQPGSQILQKGFVPLASGTPVSPPRGGSSAAKPAQVSAKPTPPPATTAPKS